MTEKSFWTLLRNNLAIKMYRVENRVGSGMPDVHYINKRASGWIELKYVDSFPKKGKVNIGLKKHQALWHKNYNAFGGVSWVLVRLSRSAIFLFKGEDADIIAKMPNKFFMMEKCVWCKRGNMGAKDWDNLKEEITNV
jgi:hypothetical protein|tara:strand:+ start:7479 stop:7892 length:414 start_codon:yes stop_codon:yes gene_type:complete